MLHHLIITVVTLFQDKLEEELYTSIQGLSRRETDNNSELSSRVAKAVAALEAKKVREDTITMKIISRFGPLIRSFLVCILWYRALHAPLNQKKSMANGDCCTPLRWVGEKGNWIMTPSFTYPLMNDPHGSHLHSIWQDSTSSPIQRAFIGNQAFTV